MSWRSIDYTRNPSVVVGGDERRACAGKPTWWWFAIPITRVASPNEKGADTVAYAGGDDVEVRRAGHERALITCVSCPLALRCVQASWGTEEYGVYGAVSEVERFYLGGRGRSVSQPRTYARYRKTLARIAKRYGSELHPVVRWIAAQPLPRGVKPPTAAEVALAEVDTEEIGRLEDGAA